MGWYWQKKTDGSMLNQFLEKKLICPTCGKNGSRKSDCEWVCEQNHTFRVDSGVFIMRDLLSYEEVARQSRQAYASSQRDLRDRKTLALIKLISEPTMPLIGWIGRP